MTSLDLQIEELIKDSNALMDKSNKTMAAQQLEIEQLKAKVNGFIKLLESDVKGGFLFNMSNAKGRVNFYNAKNALILKTPEQCLNSVKADAIEDAANKVDEAGHVEAFGILTMLAWELRGNNAKDW